MTEQQERRRRKTHSPENAADSRLVTGRFQRRPSGIGFVRPRYAVNEDAPVYDIFIPAHWTRDAASGDTVVVEILERKPKDDYGRSTRRKKRNDFVRDDRGPRGKVVDILQRASNRFVGSYIAESGWGYIQVDGSLFKRKIPIGDASATPARQGDKIVVEMVKFPTPHNDGEAVIVEVLGAHGVPGIDTQLIMRQFDLPENFGEATLAAASKEVKKFFKMFPDDEELGPETESSQEFLSHRHKGVGSTSAPPCLGEKKTPAALAKKLAKLNRVDLTNELVITIDPADARDFDDALSLQKLDQGFWRLGVHIADVTHFVAEKSPIDKEALDRATSVYLPDRVIPMLPEVISNALASLQPGKLRFTKSVYMEFNAEGVRTHTEIHRAAIRSTQRFNYSEVQEFLDDHRKGKNWRPEIRDLLLNLHELMKVLKQRRTAGGSLELSIPEPKIELNDDGAVTGAHVYPYFDSNRIVEECMLSANEAVADFLHGKKIPFLRRIHSGPSMRKLRSFVDFLRTLEIADLDAEDLYADRFTIQRLLGSVLGTAQEYAVNFSLLRSMQKAVYSPEAEGHYALASSCYTHFTSPIRRFPDLSVHRLLDAVLDGKTPKPEWRELVLLGEHCSDREQRAEEAERELVKLKLIDYMSKHIGERIEAVVTTVESFGIFVMGIDIPAEGLIRLEALNDDFYRFERGAKILMGERSDNHIRIGDKLLVEIVRADPDARQIDFRMVRRLKSDKRVAKMRKTKIQRVAEKNAKKTVKKAVKKKR